MIKCSAIFKQNIEKSMVEDDEYEEKIRNFLSKDCKLLNNEIDEMFYEFEEENKRINEIYNEICERFSSLKEIDVLNPNLRHVRINSIFEKVMNMIKARCGYIQLKNIKEYLMNKYPLLETLINFGLSGSLDTISDVWLVPYNEVMRNKMYKKLFKECMYIGHEISTAYFIKEMKNYMSFN